MLWFSGSEKYCWADIALTSKPISHHNVDNYKFLLVQWHLLIFYYLYSSIHLLIYWQIYLQYLWNQLFWQDITNVLMGGTTKNQRCWMRWHVHIAFWNTLFADCICISAIFAWFSYESITCFITNKLHVVIIETFRRIHYFLDFFSQFFPDISYFSGK